MAPGSVTMDLNENLKICRTRWKERRRIKKRVAAALLQIRQPSRNKPPSQKTLQNVSSNTLNFVNEFASLSSSDSQNFIHIPNLSTVNEISTVDLSVDFLEPSRLSKPDIIRKWAINNQVTQVALSNLLKVLNGWLPSDKFPKDSRTLLGTLRNVESIKIEGGDLFHFGIEKYIRKYLEKGGNFDNSDFVHFQNLSNVISITVGIDGLPISKSSNVQFWPILAYFCQNVSSIFLISLYCGNSKPKNIKDFLGPFISEMKRLEVEGLVFKNESVTVRIKCIIADAPARSFIKCTKNHNAYYGCERCSRKGKWRRKVTYSGFKLAALYTDSSFRNHDFNNHQNGSSPLLDLEIGLVTQIPLDFMHLCCLGVMKKLLLLWKETIPYKLSRKQLAKISKRLVSFASFIPASFNRKPRSLEEIRHWKATEFRMFLTYIGPIVLNGILDDNRYKHFMLFHTAIYILSSSTSREWVDYAGTLLNTFVLQFDTYYSKDNCVFNVHMLIHLHEEVKVHGRLSNFSAFPFENYMSKLKRLIKSHNNFLAQVVNRVHERDVDLFDMCNENPTYVRFSSQEKDNFFITTEFRICSLVNEDNGFCTVKYYEDSNNVEWYPVNSKKLGILVVKNLSPISCIIRKEQLMKNCIVIPFHDSYFAVSLCSN